VSNDYFNPGWTDYRFRIMYNAYDVTRRICPDSGFRAAGFIYISSGSGNHAEGSICISSADSPMLKQ
jgi:hypothetical protein